VAFSSWGTVHGPNSSYTRMALALVDSYFGKTAPTAPTIPVVSNAATQQLKRQRAESSTSYESGSESGQPIPALSSFRTSSRQPSLRGFSRAAPADPDPDPETPSGAASREAASTAAADAAAAGSERLLAASTPNGVYISPAILPAFDLFF
jgi:hypothetical protein